MHERSQKRHALPSVTVTSTARVLALLCAGLLALPAIADSVTDARLRISKGDVEGGLKLLEQATKEGNVSAKGVLAQSLLTLAPPYRDVARACRLASQAAGAGDAMGRIALADCLLAGEIKTDDPIEAARALARQALAAGKPEGGFELYKIYLLDPAYSTLKDGKPDKAKQDALAARPIAERGVQIEALNALSGALATGNYAALDAFILYLSETSAPSNIDRLLNTSVFLQRVASIVPLQAGTQKIIQAAQSIRQLGTTNVSQKVVLETYPALIADAAKALSRKAKSSCDTALIKLSAIAAEPIANAEYLPLKGILSNTYLLRGSWNENWTYAGCDTEVEWAVRFTADGVGGVTYTAKLLASK